MDAGEGREDSNRRDAPQTEMRAMAHGLVDRPHHFARVAAHPLRDGGAIDRVDVECVVGEIETLAPPASAPCADSGQDVRNAPASAAGMMSSL